MITSNLLQKIKFIDRDEGQDSVTVKGDQTIAYSIVVDECVVDVGMLGIDEHVAKGGESQSWFFGIGFSFGQC